MGITFYEQVRDFDKEHPELGIASMLGAFHTCTGHRTMSLQEAFNHVYGNGDKKSGCSWCQQQVKRDRSEKRK